MTEIIWSSERSWEQAERGDWGLCIRLCTKQLSAANPFLPFIMVFPVCSVHTGWDVIARASCECSVINTAAQARVVSMRRIAAKLAMYCAGRTE